MCCTKPGLKEALYLNCVTEEFEILDMYMEHTVVDDTDSGL